MKPGIFFLLLAAALHAAVDGTVTNGTTGKPQPSIAVSLVNLGGAGMEPLGSTTSDAAGKFRLEQTPTGPALLQAVHQGVTYNMMLQPGSPSSGLALEVYDASSRPEAAKVLQDVVLLEPSGTQLFVRETIIWQNQGKTTYVNAAAGTLRVYVPPEGKDSLRVSATPPGGLPLGQPASAAGENTYKVDYPIKPGETSFEASYQVPFSGSFAGKSLQKGAALRLVVPVGVALAGDGLESLGQEPQTQASIYGVKTAEYKVEIQGTPAPASSSGGGAENNASSGLSEILPRVYDNVYLILGLSLTILALGFVLLYRMRKTPVQRDQAPAAPRSKKRR